MSSPSPSVVVWSRWKPSLARTRNDGTFHDRTVDHRRVRPVAKAASTRAVHASVAYP